MDKKTLENFFAGKFFRVPAYQRDYAWTATNVDDLWGDIREALDLKASHYLGTFVLCRPPGATTLDVVDGQQRLTTITMLLRSLVDRLEDARKKIVTEDRFLSEGTRHRLTLLGTNEEFFRELLEGRSPTPASAGQRRLVAAYQRIQDLVTQLAESSPNSILKWIDGIGQLNVLEFLEEDAGSAIRIFETVNDRGRPLATIDKVKSYLIYVSSRYLAGALDLALQQAFGRVFHAFDRARETGGRDVGVTLVAAETFTEDQLLRYHFLAYPSDYHDYKLRTEEILGTFLKGSVRQKIGDLPALKEFVGHYAEDLASFFEAFAELMERAATDAKYYKFFAVLGPNTRLYPILIRLQALRLLDSPCLTGGQRTFLDLVELVELRAFKTGGVQARKDMAVTARDALTLPPAATFLSLLNFVLYYQGDHDFRAALSGHAYQKNEAVGYILLEHDEAYRTHAQRPVHTMDELRRMSQRSPTIDHILATAPSFSCTARGFRDEEEYEEAKDQIGNLALVEKSINSAAQELSPEQKAKAENLYQGSDYVATRLLGAAITSSAQSGAQFGATDIRRRTAELVDFCLDRWALSGFISSDRTAGA